MHRGHANLAYRFLNGYLQQTGDYAGLELLPFYLSYRAMVRAKIAGFRLAQEPSTAARRDCLDYLLLADESLKRRRPALIITHGLPGCGKSTVSQMLLEKHLLIRLRSDIERKRLFGLSALQQSGSTISGGIYNAQASERVYRHLLEQARTLLENGYAVIIDAAFLKHQQRQPFRHLAQQMNAAFAILTIQARDDILRQRILDRQQRGDDPSEAGLTVLDHAICEQEALQTDELVDTLVLHNDFGEPGCADQQPAWRELARLLQ